MRRVRLELPQEAVERLFDQLLHELPHGVRTVSVVDGRVLLETYGAEGELPGRADFEAAAGVPLEGWLDEAASADTALRRAGIDGGVRIAGRLLIRSPTDPVPTDATLLDVVIERTAGGFGTGSHPTTRMCLEMLLALPRNGGLADLGCGLGVLSIVAARLGWQPVVGVDRDPEAIAAARANALRNGVEVEFVEAELSGDALPDVATIAMNAPPDMHAMVAAGLPSSTRVVLASGVPTVEADGVLEAYAAAGMVLSERRDENVWTAAMLVRPDE